MKDVFGREIQIYDVIAYAARYGYGAEQIIFFVIDITDKGIIAYGMHLNQYNRKWKYNTRLVTLTNPHQAIVIDDLEFTAEIGHLILTAGNYV